MVKFTLFNELVIEVSNENYKYLCENRFFTDTPTLKDIECEFVSGTGITPNKKDLWSVASLKFEEYIKDLQYIQI